MNKIVSVDIVLNVLVASKVTSVLKMNGKELPNRPLVQKDCSTDNIFFNK